MARIRTVKPEFFSDPHLGRLSLAARYLYLATWCFADDTGRLPADARLLKSQAFPYDDALSVKKVRGLIQELIESGKVMPYTVDGVDYLFLPKFRIHQKVNRPQPPKYPPPPGEFTADSLNGQGTVTEDSPPISDTTLSEVNYPLTPAQRGNRKLNPRALGTSPRQLADAERRRRLDRIETCTECGGKGLVFDEEADVATPCERCRRRAS